MGVAKRLTAKQRRARTYTVLVAILLVTGLVWAALWWSGRGSEPEPPETSATPTDSAEATEDPSPSESASPSANYEGLGESGLPSDAPACEIGDIEIQAMTDATEYGADDPVMMRFMIVNTGSVPCQMNVGTSQQDYVITAGSETVFRASDCMTDRVDQLVTLEPDDARQSTEIEWNRRYSDEASCNDQLEKVPEGQSYTLTVVVAGIESQGTRDFTLR